MQNNYRWVILTWGENLTRSMALESSIDFSVNVDIHLSGSSLVMKIIKYFYCYILSLYYIFILKYEGVIIVAPPSLSLFLIPVIKIFQPEAKIYADLHNGVLRKSWSCIPGVSFCLGLCSKVICHNSFVKNKIDREFNVSCEVLVDPLLKFKRHIDDDLLPEYFPQNESVPLVVIPCSFREDEPFRVISCLAKFASETKKFRVLITGRKEIAPKILKNCSYSCDALTGFLSRTDYEYLICNADVILCLSNDNDVQMCALNEALGAGTLFLHSATDTLNSIYGELDLGVSNDEVEIIETLQFVFENSSAYKKKVQLFSKKYMHEWHLMAGDLGL